MLRAPNQWDSGTPKQLWKEQKVCGNEGLIKGARLGGKGVE